MADQPCRGVILIMGHGIGEDGIAGTAVRIKTEGQVTYLQLGCPTICVCV